MKKRTRNAHADDDADALWVLQRPVAHKRLDAQEAPPRRAVAVHDVDLGHDLLLLDGAVLVVLLLVVVVLARDVGRSEPRRVAQLVRERQRRPAGPRARVEIVARRLDEAWRDGDTVLENDERRHVRHCEEARPSARRARLRKKCRARRTVEASRAAVVDREEPDARNLREEKQGSISTSSRSESMTGVQAHLVEVLLDPDPLA